MPCAFAARTSLVQLRAGGNGIIDHKHVQTLFGLLANGFFMHGADNHAAGFDAHREEDQAQLLMVERDYAFLGRRVASCKSEIPECRGVVAVLEGGYNTSSLARSCAAFIHQLACTD